MGAPLLPPTHHSVPLLLMPPCRPAAAAAAPPLHAEREKESTMGVEMVAQRSRGAAGGSGATLYDFEYELDTTRGRKRVLSTGALHSAGLRCAAWAGGCVCAADQPGLVSTFGTGLGGQLQLRLPAPVPDRHLPTPTPHTCSDHRGQQAVHCQRQHLLRQGAQLRRRGGAAAAAARRHAVPGGDVTMGGVHLLPLLRRRPLLLASIPQQSVLCTTCFGVILL